MRTGLDALEDRTKSFTVDAIQLCIALERLPGLRQLTWQLVDSAGSVGSNHRAMRRARSTREFASKLQIVNEEIDESVFWLEVAHTLYPQTGAELPALLNEGRELRSIFAKARSTTRLRTIVCCTLACTAAVRVAFNWLLRS
jgi:four helix bundle protein